MSLSFRILYSVGFISCLFYEVCRFICILMCIESSRVFCSFHPLWHEGRHSVATALKGSQEEGKRKDEYTGSFCLLK